MTDTTTRLGQCMCGAVKLEARSAKNDVGACHCSQCRQWCSGPFMTVECGTDIEFTGEESISVFDSSDWAERAFCNKCGSSLYYRLKGSGEYFVAAGLFGDTAGLKFSDQVFIDEKPAFYSFAEKTKNLTGAELFAMFGA